jgi:predicted Zn-ribbon and HTH transcriptional regulator
MIALLSEEEMGARDISQSLGIREKEVYAHLPHISRSVAARGKRLVILPARCLGCGFVFEDRRRFTRPGRCPRCKGTHLQIPMYRIR